MRDKGKARRGKYKGELRSRFNVIEQWNGVRWAEPPEVGDYGDDLAPIHFDVEDGLRPGYDPGDTAFLPRRR